MSEFNNFTKSFIALLETAGNSDWVKIAVKAASEPKPTPQLLSALLEAHQPTKPPTEKELENFNQIIKALNGK